MSQFFAALCNVIAARRLYTSNLRNYHWICPICMAGQQEELCLSLVLHSTSEWNRAEAIILNAELCYSQDITNHHFVIFKAPPTLNAHATRLKSLQISIRSVQSAWYGAERSSVLCHFFAALCNVRAERRAIEPNTFEILPGYV